MDWAIIFTTSHPKQLGNQWLFVFHFTWLDLCYNNIDYLSGHTKQLLNIAGGISVNKEPCWKEIYQMNVRYMQVHLLTSEQSKEL